MSVESDLTLGYLDDWTLGGHQSQVTKDVQRVIEVGRDMGLHLNVSELIAESGTNVSDPFLQTFQRFAVQDATLP